ncbi:MAG: ABC transporter permease [Phycisphaerales bacterium]|nr:ABC transporter permease [Phycisphaerales bacterium]
MGNIWTITRHTLAESVRQKTAMFLVIVLCVLVLAMPFTARGDNSLSGAVQSFLSYSLTITGFLLSCVTIFLSKTISDDLTGKQILMLMTKPIARWQYVVGKWLGIVLLNVIVLTLVGCVIYAMTIYLAGHRRGWYVATGVAIALAVFICYTLIRNLRPVQFSLTRWITVGVLCAIVVALLGGAVVGLNRYQSTLKPRDDYDRDRLDNQILQARHAAKFKAPWDVIRAQANAEFDKGVEQGKYTGETNAPAVKAQLFDGMKRRWRSVWPLESRVFEFEDVRTDRSPESRIYISYRLRVFRYPPDEILRCVWVVGDRSKGATEYRIPRRDVIDRRHTMPVPADAVAPDGTLTAAFVNVNPWVEAGEEQADNVVVFEGDDAIEALFSVSSFGTNLIRALALVVCRLAFLAAIAVMLTTVFSFPVACLVALTAYFVAATPSFMADAIDWMPDEGVISWFSAALNNVLWAVHAILLPKFTAYDGVSTLVEGRNVTLMWVIMAFGRLVLIQTTVLLLAACLLFRKREVSQVSF